MKKEKLVIGNWYWIEYKHRNPKRSFTGKAKLKRISEEYNEYWFYSPMNDSEEGMVQMIFNLRDIKHETSPLPSYAELYSKYQDSFCIR